MAETLGSLVDKLTIKQLREFYLKKLLGSKKSGVFSDDGVRVLFNNYGDQVITIIPVRYTCNYSDRMLFKNHLVALLQAVNLIVSDFKVETVCFASQADQRQKQ